MATIREILVLEDKFTQTFARFESLVEESASALNDIRYSLNNVETASAASAQAMVSMGSQTSGAARTATASTDALGNSVKRLLAQFVGFQAIRGIINISDQMTAATARLDMMNDGLQTTAELNQMIFDSAERSRGSYQSTADLVSKLGVLAPEAFSSSREIVDFAEQINKQMAIAGTSTYGADAAMLQLTQAMASGVLRGEELNSVLEQAPTIAQAIADYMEVDVGTMRQLASEGKITAQVVKNAMFAAADETNAKFESMPYTWGQVFTQVQNTLMQVFQPVLQVIGQFADLAGENIVVVIGLLYGLAAAAAFYAVAQGIATGAAKAFFTTLMSNPLMWIALLIGVVVAAIASWVQSVGGLQAAWAICQNFLLTTWANLKIAFMTVVYAIQAWGMNLQVGFYSIVYGIADAVGWMKVQVLTLIEGMVNGAIDLINGFINAVNAILGTSIGAIDKVTFGATAAVEYEAEKQARADDLANRRAEYEQLLQDQEASINQMRAERDADRAEREQAIAEMQAGSAASGVSGGYGEEIAENTASTAGSAGSIEKSLGLAEEDLKSLVDVAEQRYVNRINLTAQTPVINITGANTGNTPADRQRLADMIRDTLVEQWSSGGNMYTNYAITNA